LSVLGDPSDGLVADPQTASDGPLAQALREGAFDGLSGGLARLARVGPRGEGLVAVFAAASCGPPSVGAVLDDGLGPLAVRANDGVSDHAKSTGQESCHHQRSQRHNQPNDQSQGREKP
jgi:hypothetical protein